MVYLLDPCLYVGSDVYTGVYEMWTTFCPTQTTIWYVSMSARWLACLASSFLVYSLRAKVMVVDFSDDDLLTTAKVLAAITANPELLAESAIAASRITVHLGAVQTIEDNSGSTPLVPPSADVPSATNRENEQPRSARVTINAPTSKQRAGGKKFYPGTPAPGRMSPTATNENPFTKGRTSPEGSDDNADDDPELPEGDTGQPRSARVTINAPASKQRAGGKKFYPGTPAPGRMSPTATNENPFTKGQTSPEGSDDNADDDPEPPEGDTGQPRSARVTINAPTSKQRAGGKKFYPGTPAPGRMSPTATNENPFTKGRTSPEGSDDNADDDPEPSEGDTGQPRSARVTINAPTSKQRAGGKKFYPGTPAPGRMSPTATNENPFTKGRTSPEGSDDNADDDPEPPEGDTGQPRSARVTINAPTSKQRAGGKKFYPGTPAPGRMSPTATNENPFTKGRTSPEGSDDNADDDPEPSEGDTGQPRSARVTINAPTSKQRAGGKKFYPGTPAPGRMSPTATNENPFTKGQTSPEGSDDNADDDPEPSEGDTGQPRSARVTINAPASKQRAGGKKFYPGTPAPGRMSPTATNENPFTKGRTSPEGSDDNADDDPEPSEGDTGQPRSARVTINAPTSKQRAGGKKFYPGTPAPGRMSPTATNENPFTKGQTSPEGSDDNADDDPDPPEGDTGQPRSARVTINAPTSKQRAGGKKFYPGTPAPGRMSPTATNENPFTKGRTSPEGSDDNADDDPEPSEGDTGQPRSARVTINAPTSKQRAGGKKFYPGTPAPGRMSPTATNENPFTKGRTSPEGSDDNADDDPEPSEGDTGQPRSARVTINAPTSKQRAGGKKFYPGTPAPGRMSPTATNENPFTKGQTSPEGSDDNADDDPEPPEGDTGQPRSARVTINAPASKQRAGGKKFYPGTPAPGRMSPTATNENPFTKGQTSPEGSDDNADDDPEPSEGDTGQPRSARVTINAPTSKQRAGGKKFYPGTPAPGRMSPTATNENPFTKGRTSPEGSDDNADDVSEPSADDTGQPRSVIFSAPASMQPPGPQIFTPASSVPNGRLSATASDENPLETDPADDKNADGHTEATGKGWVHANSARVTIRQKNIAGKPDQNLFVVSPTPSGRLPSTATNGNPFLQQRPATGSNARLSPGTSDEKKFLTAVADAAAHVEPGHNDTVQPLSPQESCKVPAAKLRGQDKRDPASTPPGRLSPTPAHDHPFIKEWVEMDNSVLQAFYWMRPQSPQKQSATTVDSERSSGDAGDVSPRQHTAPDLTMSGGMSPVDSANLGRITRPSQSASELYRAETAPICSRVSHTEMCMMLRQQRFPSSAERPQVAVAGDFRDSGGDMFKRTLCTTHKYGAVKR